MGGFFGGWIFTVHLKMVETSHHGLIRNVEVSSTRLCITYRRYNTRSINILFSNIGSHDLKTRNLTNNAVYPRRNQIYIFAPAKNVPKIKLANFQMQSATG